MKAKVNTNAEKLQIEATIRLCLSKADDQTQETNVA